MPIRMPAGAAYLLNALVEKGFSSYIVGGCVRDSLLGLAPKDWDICTAAKPDEVKECLAGERILETGVKHGTVTVLLPDGQYEVTTFRIDGTYSDNRRPDFVEFVRDVEADLARRDFTVNAMAYNEKEGLIDPFGGRDCLRKGIIRCVGEPRERFLEDGLRIMRAIRFASVYGFSIDPPTAAAIHEKKDLLKNIAAERIREELCKLLGGKNVSQILVTYRDCLTVVLPEAEGAAGSFARSARALSLYGGEEISVRMALLLLGIPGMEEEAADRIMRRLKFDNKTRRNTVLLLAGRDVPVSTNRASVRRMLSEMGEEQFFRWLKMKKANEAARASGTQTERLSEYDAAADLARQLLAEKQCLTLGDLAVNGNDVMAIGAAKGKEVGDLLTLALNAVLNGTVRNRKEDLLSYLRDMRIRAEKTP